MFKRTEKDEAIDAAVFLARRDLRAWLERTRAERSKYPFQPQSTPTAAAVAFRGSHRQAFVRWDSTAWI